MSLHIPLSCVPAEASSVTSIFRTATESRLCIAPVRRLTHQTIVPGYWGLSFPTFDESMLETREENEMVN